MNIGVIGSSYTEENQSHTSLEFQSASSGDILNMYEKLVLDSKWQLIDEEIGSTFVLGRGHMFYTSGGNAYKKLENEVIKDNKELDEQISVYFNKKTSITLFTDAFKLLSENGLGDVSLATRLYYDVQNKSADSIDESVYDVLLGHSTKKISENHFAISGHNLIHHEIAVNDATYNTIKMDYKVFSFKNAIVATILPKTYSSETKNKHSKTLEKIVEPIIPNMKKETNNPAIDNRKTAEFLSNQLLDELRWCYQGKIFMLYLPNVKIGDTISLLDNTTSTFGKFLIDTYEHVLDARGLITILNVKACVDIVDPYLDIYNRKIALELSDDIGNVLLTKDRTTTETIALSNLLALYNKAMMTNTKYCKMIECEEPDIFSPLEEYPVVGDQSNMPALAVRFIPFSKKGKVQIPESLKSAFLYDETNEFSKFSQQLYNQVAQNFTSGIRTAKKWTTSVLLFACDTILDIATFGLHELVKATSGYTAKKAINTNLDDSKLTSDNIDILLKGTDYTASKEKDNYELTFGFFNVEAQRKTNVTPGVMNDNMNIDFSKVKNQVSIKSGVIRNIINDYFHVCGCVEMYTSFKFDGADYNITNFIDDCVPTGYSKQEENLFTNKYGEEKGVLFYDTQKANLNDASSQYPITQSVKTFGPSSGDTTRNYIETTIKTQGFGYKDKNGNPIDEIRFIWFHNIFGKTDLEFDSRIKNIEYLIDEYGRETNYKDNVGIIILGDHNVEVVNPGEKPKGDSIAHVFLNEKNSRGFRNYMKKPTTLNKKGKVEGNIYENVLLSPNLIKNKEFIDVMRVMYFYSGVERSEVSDHVPAFVGLRKRT